MTWLPAGLTFTALEACSSLCVSFSLQNYNIFSINLTKIKKILIVPTILVFYLNFIKKCRSVPSGL